MPRASTARPALDARPASREQSVISASSISCASPQARWRFSDSMRLAASSGSSNTSAITTSLGTRLTLRSGARLSLPVLRRADLLEGGAASEVVGIGERLDHLEVVVPLCDDQLDRLSVLAQGLSEVAALALEFRRLKRAVDDHHRCADALEIALRAQLIERFGRELYVRAARRK